MREQDAQTPVNGHASSELRRLAHLAAPLVLTNVGNMAMGVVDTAVVGRLGETSMAAAALGNAIFFVPSIFGMGLLLGLDALVSQALGAGDGGRARRLLWQGIWLSLAISVPLCLGVVALTDALHSFPIPPETIAPTRAYLIARLPGIPAFLALTAVRSYLTGRQRTRSLVAAMLIANAVNLPANIALGFGVPELGVPALGIAGTGIASSIASFVQLGIGALPLAFLAIDGVPGAAPVRRLQGALVWSILRLGLPLGFQFVLEASTFSIVTFLMGAFGTVTLAAHNVALMLVSTTFQIALGIGAATSTRVGTAIGRGDVAATRRAGMLGVGAGMASMLAGALLFIALPGPLARALTDQQAVIDAALPFFFVAGCFQISDGVQTIAQGALRGAGDSLVPMLINFSGHYLIGLPLGYALAFRLDLGATGLWWGLAIGLSVVAVAMTRRFLILSARPIARA